MIHYTDSKGASVVIADMAFPHLQSAHKKAVAEKVKPRAAWVRARVIDALTRQGPMTTVQIAAALGLPYEAVQPRTKEGKALGTIEDSGLRGPSRDPSKSAIVWRIATASVVSANEGDT